MDAHTIRKILGANKTLCKRGLYTPRASVLHVAHLFLSDRQMLVFGLLARLTDSFGNRPCELFVVATERTCTSDWVPERSFTGTALTKVLNGDKSCSWLKKRLNQQMCWFHADFEEKQNKTIAATTL